MKNFLITTSLIVLGIVTGIIYWAKQIVCFPVDILLWLLSKAYVNIYKLTPQGYFSVVPKTKKEIDEYCKKAEEQFKKCNCKECEELVARAKLIKEIMGLTDSPTTDTIVGEKHSPGAIGSNTVIVIGGAGEGGKDPTAIKNPIEEVTCSKCGSVCKFNGDSRVYDCPKCNK